MKTTWFYPMVWFAFTMGFTCFEIICCDDFSAESSAFHWDKFVEWLFGHHGVRRSIGGSIPGTKLVGLPRLAVRWFGCAGFMMANAELALSMRAKIRWQQVCIFAASTFCNIHKQVHYIFPIKTNNLVAWILRYEWHTAINEYDTQIISLSWTSLLLF